MYRIRFHGRGGQGIKTASQVLGTAFFFEGFEVQDAPRYGAERRGAPMFAYVRAARGPIYERGVIAVPDLVVVADATLIPVPSAGVLAGIATHTVVVINDREPAEAWRDRLQLSGPLLTLPALTGETPEHLAASSAGARCAGAAARLVGVIRRATLADALRDEIGRLGPAALRDSLAEALTAFDTLAAQAGIVREGVPVAATDYRAPDWIDVPFDDARLSAPAIRAAATSTLVDTGAWRTHTPVIDYELCTRCAWVCGTFCPDSAIAVAADHTPRIDYDHCKGCMVCVAVCPPHAIRAVPVPSPDAVAPTTPPSAP